MLFLSAEKIIRLESFTVSAAEIWSRWVDWVVQGDNAKYLPALSQLGGEPPVDLYIYLENGWRIKPQEADGLTRVTGNLLVAGDPQANPFVGIDGNYSATVSLEAPVKATAVATGGSALTAEQHNKLMGMVTEIMEYNGP